MKITLSQLKRLIREEVESFGEQSCDCGECFDCEADEDVMPTWSDRGFNLGQGGRSVPMRITVRSLRSITRGDNTVAARTSRGSDLVPYLSTGLKGVNAL